MKKIALPQLIPQNICLKCDICCRFSEEFSHWAPYILKEEIADFSSEKIFPFFIKSYGINLNLKKEKDLFICPFFDLSHHRCSLYPLRPFDCQLYPFVLFYNQTYTGVVLGIDLQCPYLREIEREYLLNFALKLKEILEETSTLEMIYQNPGIIMSPHPNFQPLILWDKLNKIIFGKNLGLKIISLEDREIFKQFFMKKNITFSYAFEYLYAWKDIAYLLWKIIDKELLVFWKQKDDFFLLLSPGDALSLPVLSFIKNFLGKEIIIKNIGEEYLNFFKKNNWELKSEGQEYIYECEKIATLEGKDLKSRRWQSNYFYKHCLPRVRELKNEDIAECLELYVNWAEEKRRKNRPPYYFMLIEDNFFAQRRLLIDYVKLNLAGIVIEVEGKIVGYSFGYPLNEEEFCIFSEITNLKFKGITPYIFQEFCRKLKNYKFINAMDDAGLENLRRIKCAYAPLRIRRLYSAKYIQGEGFC